MTHEYVIAVHGLVEPCAPLPEGQPATAIAWAFDRVLAVGTDASVRAISRGDSTVLDLEGCIVTPLPDDVRSAETLVEEAWSAGNHGSLGDLLVRIGLLGDDALLEPGSPSNLAFWRAGPGDARPRVVAVVREGAFIEGDEHRGPFRRA
jgi:hypothetical protein